MGRGQMWWVQVRAWVVRIALRVRTAGEAGMTTAEYAVGTVAAVAFAVALIGVVRSDAVRGALASIITSALSSAR